ncbi:hypothetical protein B0H66DRAFT_632321 [Apodospora peruviana]|uniref:Uncharacterized protein n=1 Tax=Apodospora peruviana TaxID=516989 RepID=A0AAE0HUP1_9PEZI|nr:hypothetical protein B0H66DRAFT_632321 [Apodospora peruviana]
MKFKDKFIWSKNSKSNHHTSSTTSHSSALQTDNARESMTSAKAAQPGSSKTTEGSDAAVGVAPAVTHEVVRPHVHEVVEEQVSREIHTHDVYHRIQPVKEVEVQAPRHFVPDAATGGLVEVSEEDVNRVYRAREGDGAHDGATPTTATTAAPASRREFRTEAMAPQEK